MFTPAFTDACRELGYEEAPDKNAPANDGVGPVPFNIGDGHRIGTALGYLIPAMARPNFQLIGNAVVQRVLFDGTRARRRRSAGRRRPRPRSTRLRS